MSALCCGRHGGGGHLPIHYANVECDGSEEVLASCGRSDVYRYCNHNEDAAVSCHPGEVIIIIITI